MGQSQLEIEVPHVLERLDQVDANWLTAALRRAGHDDVQVDSFTMTPIGHGNVSETVRVDLVYRAKTHAPASVVCKFRAQRKEAHAHGINSGSYHREVGSYRMVEQACRTPRVLWLEGGHDNINLVMEDLSATARVGDQIAGCGPSDAAAVVSELATLHHAFYPMDEADAPHWAMKMAADAEYWNAAIQRALPIIHEHVAHRLSEMEIRLVEAACAVALAWYRLPVPNGALTHGDPRVDNILFLDGPKSEVQAVLIDWQLTGWRNPMHDVGYFLSGSVSVADRRLHERGLLENYAGRFADTYTLGRVIDDYRIQLLSGLMTTVASYGLIPLTPGLDALLFALMQRNLAAAADWDSIAAVRTATR